MQFPIQSGAHVVEGSFRTSHPRNLYHKTNDSGVSRGQLVSAHGAVQVATGPGIDRGGTVWREGHFRVMGSKLVAVDASGAITLLGEVTSDGLTCQFAYGFDQFAVASSDRLYYWNGTTLVQVTDPDLGIVKDVCWIDGYFVTTDGEYIIVTDLNDPTSVDPLKYGSAETVPDPISGVAVVNEELLAIGRYSIQFFTNVGGNGFPFRNVDGAMIPFGAVSARAKVNVLGTLAFVGGAEGEPLGVYLIAGGTAQRFSDEGIDAMLADCGDESSISMEARYFGDEVQIVVHTGECSAALCLRASEKAESGLWHRLDTDGGAYRPRNAVLAYGKHFVGDVGSEILGVLDNGTDRHFGVQAGWQFESSILFNDTRGYILHEVEITGQFPAVSDEDARTTVFFSITRDGQLWSLEKGRTLTGRRDERVVWRPNTRVNRMCGLRFRGHGKVAVSRGDATPEALAT